MALPENQEEIPTSLPIPKGLATKLGVGGGVIAAVLAVLAEIFDVEMDTETLVGLISSVVLLVTTMAGRFAQAYAQYRDAPSPFQIGTDFIAAGGDFDEFEDFIEERAPDDAELVETFPEDPPPQDDVPGQDPPEEPQSSALGLQHEAEQPQNPKE